MSADGNTKNGKPSMFDLSNVVRKNRQEDADAADRAGKRREEVREFGEPVYPKVMHPGPQHFNDPPAPPKPPPRPSLRKRLRKMLAENVTDANVAEIIDVTKGKAMSPEHPDQLAAAKYLMDKMDELPPKSAVKVTNKAASFTLAIQQNNAPAAAAPGGDGGKDDDDDDDSRGNDDDDGRPAQLPPPPALP